MEKKHSDLKSFDQRNLPPTDPQYTMNNTEPHIQNKVGKDSITNQYRKVVKANPSPVEKEADSQQSPINPDSSLVSPALCTEIKISTIKKEKDTSETEASPRGDAENESAKAKLYELCAANKWKLPCFECYKEEGPSHSRQFSFKVITEVKDESRVTLLECFSAPRSKKKAAAEHAAEGALWYLKHLGYCSKESSSPW
ncbi:hypothetical protein EUGRSUZ_J03093 [Eucalyptus grandis]|uniref:Uncharacterized protein n=2 Tax=Eucalyptus grandis TaxID=71139 RepID=A0ACC3JBP5_EUCGR|nr:hypothetical protein EUGRSUZ_J03093 [Eucalyptus grandis]